MEFGNRGYAGFARGWLVGVPLVFTLAVILAALMPPPSAGAATPTDVMFLFDTSGSMEEVLSEATAEMQQVMTRIESVVPEVDYGVAEVRDYGGSFYDEDEDDSPWRLVTPLTSNRAAVTAAISDLSATGGGDGPEAYGRALWETDTNPTVGWRPGARQAIILIADNVPHMPNVNLGISEPLWLEPSPWDTGEELPGAWGIADSQLPVSQKTEFLEVLPRLVGDGRPLEMVDYHETDAPNYVHYWEYWAGLAGGLALEAGSGTKELANKLIGLIERAAPPCASAVTPSVPSPLPPGTLPSALTARFGGPGTRVTIVPAAGFRFCSGQHPYLGGISVTSLEESTPSQMAFQVPPNAAGGLAISSPAGSVSPPSSFEVDNFRYPWGFNTMNSPGSGGGHTYDVHAKVSDEDLRSVFADLGPSSSIAYLVAEYEAESMLKDGLCYGFSVISQALYGDSHGAKHQYPLGWASSSGFQLQPTTTPYSLHEASGGDHALTHALLRAAMTQLSPQAEGSRKNATSEQAVQADLDAAFKAGQPATLLIHYNGGGHAMLAYNYQVTGEGLSVDVVDPNVPWGPSRPPTDYETLQVHVKPNGSWTFTGSFEHGTFGDPVSGGPGSIWVVAEPPMPGGLSFVPSDSSGRPVEVHPGAGDTVSAVSYSASAGKGIPGDVEPRALFTDSTTNGVSIPSSHHTVTTTIKSKSGKQTSAVLIGPGFIDLAKVPKGEGDLTVVPEEGTIGAPMLPAGSTLSATSVIGEIQHTATVTFSGKVRKPRVTVDSNGAVTVTATGGKGQARIKLAFYATGHKARALRKTVRISGKTLVRTHTPKVKHRKHRKHSKACKKGHC
jgi:hypothetical protein